MYKRSGVNGTFLYSANGSMTAAESGNSSGCYTLHEEGTYANGTWNLGCMLLDESGQWNSAYSYSGHDSASNTTGFSIAGSFSGSGSDAGSMSLHEEGTYANGSWNLSSYAETGNELWSDQSESDESQSDGTYGSTSTQTSSDQGTYSLYRTGTYGNGSFSFGCYALIEQFSSTKVKTESGGNSVLANYSRDDKNEYRYSYSQSANGSYTQSATETVTRGFNDGTTQTNSSVPLTYTQSGTRSTSSGEVFVPDPEGARPSGTTGANGEFRIGDPGFSNSLANGGGIQGAGLQQVGGDTATGDEGFWQGGGDFHTGDEGFWQSRNADFHLTDDQLWYLLEHSPIRGSWAEQVGGGMSTGDEGFWHTGGAIHTGDEGFFQNPGGGAMSEGLATPVVGAATGNSGGGSAGSGGAGGSLTSPPKPTTGGSSGSGGQGGGLTPVSITAPSPSDSNQGNSASKPPSRWERFKKGFRDLVDLFTPHTSGKPIWGDPPPDVHYDLAGGIFNIPKKPYNGPDAVDQVWNRLGRGPLLMGSGQFYGPDGNSNMGQAMTQAGMDINRLANFAAFPLMFTPLGALLNGSMSLINAMTQAQLGDAEGALISLLGVLGAPNPCGGGPLALVSRLANLGLGAYYIDKFLEAWKAGDKQGAMLNLLGALSHLAQGVIPCFPAGTHLRTKDGSKPIEEFRVGDKLLSAPEHDVEGAVEEREVESLTTKVSPILEMGVEGRKIRVTPEHPFWVRGTGWLTAKELLPGDMLRSHDGRWVALQSLKDTGEVVTVYNLGVYEYHTYFVGEAAWGFSVWSHNVNSAGCGEGRAGKQSKLRELGDDPNLSRSIRGWIKQELNQIARGKRNSIRLPGSSRVREAGGRKYGGRSGMALAHQRGKEARKGFGYKYSDLQDVINHLIQHHHEGYR